MQKALADNKKPDQKKKQPTKPLRKSSFGFTLGGGLTQSNPTFSGNLQTGYLGVDANSALTLDLGFIYQVNLGNTISIRPATTVNFETMDVDFQRRNIVGGPIITETVSVKTTAVNIALPVIIRLSSKNIAPYISLGPSFNYIFSQDKTSSEILPVKKSLLLGDAGLGVDIHLLKSGIIFSPELKYSAGLSDINDNATSSSQSAALSDLKKNAFTLSFYLRKR